MKRLLPALLAVLLLSGCSLLQPPADPAAAAEHYRQAKTLIMTKDYASAAEQLGMAQALAPGDGRYALEHADLREALGEDETARSAYRQGLDGLADADPLHPVLAWRLALLDALKLDDPQAARSLAENLRPDSFRALDLDGVLLLQAGAPDAAVTRFEQALPLAHDSALEAFALYHAALAHRRLGHDQPTFANLFKAINQATDRGLAKDIERFFLAINHN